jgi:hypothetical protein
MTRLNGVISLPPREWDRLCDSGHAQRDAISIKSATTGGAPNPHPSSVEAARHRPASCTPRPTSRCPPDAAARSLLPMCRAARPASCAARLRCRAASRCRSRMSVTLSPSLGPTASGPHYETVSGPHFEAGETMALHVVVAASAAAAPACVAVVLAPSLQLVFPRGSRLNTIRTVK